MPKPRYDEERDETRYAAAGEDDCRDMEAKYGWKLKGTDTLDSMILKADCVFDGYCEFPGSQIDVNRNNILTEAEEENA